MLKELIFEPSRLQSSTEPQTQSVPSSTQEIDWTGVRPVYRAICEEFGRLTEPFGITLSTATRTDLAVLIIAMDSIDRELDTTTDTGERTTLSNAILSYLRGNESAELLGTLGIELSERLSVLRESLCRLGIENEFLKTAEAILLVTEQKRHATDVKDFIRCLETEWRLVGEMPLQILGGQAHPRFRLYFLRLCGSMYPFDTIPDMRADHRQGQISIRPSLRLAVRMVGRVLWDLPWLIYKFPKRWKIVGYAVALWRANRKPRKTLDSTSSSGGEECVGTSRVVGLEKG